MTKMRWMAAFAALGLWGSALAVPGQVSWSGRLMDATGVPISGTHDVVVVFHDAAVATESSDLHTEAFVGVPFSGGFASLALGSSTALPAAVLQADAVWLEIRVDGAALGDLQPLGSSPWALTAGGLSQGGDTLLAGGGELRADAAGGTDELVVSEGRLTLDAHTAIVSSSMQLGSLHVLTIHGSSCTDEGWNAVIANGRDSTWMHIEMAFAHCGGGCHGTYRDWKGYFNAYVASTAVYDHINNFDSGGSWTFGRTTTATGANGPVSDQTTITKIPNGTYHYCGPVDIRVESNRPLSLLSQSG